VVIFGNGYDSPSQCASLVVLDAETGKEVEVIQTSFESPCDCNGLSGVLPVDVTGDTRVDYVYAGDLRGNLWKFDLTNESPSKWRTRYRDGSNNPQPLFTARGPNNQIQPITTTPSIMKHPNGGYPGFMVLFGTGRYLNTGDLDSTDVQTIYGVWDYGDADDEYLGTFDRGDEKELSNQPNSVSMLEQTQIFYQEVDFPNEDHTAKLRVLSDNAIIWKVEDDTPATDAPNLAEGSHAGWYFDLHLADTDFKERVIRTGQIRQGQYVIITSIPNRSPCAAGGDSIVHLMNAATGGRLATAQLDIDRDAAITAGDLIEIDNPDYDPNDVPSRIMVATTGIHFKSMLYSPAILRMNEQMENWYLGRGSGGTEVQPVQAEQTGMYYWIER